MIVQLNLVKLVIMMLEVMRQLSLICQQLNCGTEGASAVSATKYNINS